MKIRIKDFLKMNENNNIIISLSEIEKIINNVFNDTKVSSVNTTYEKTDEGYKLILTLNNIFYDKVDLIHNKFVFYVDKDKRQITNNFFHYLYDINCNFRTVKFNDASEIENKLNNILNKRKFGDELLTLSDLNVTMVTKVNDWLKNEDINNVSIYSIAYNPVVDVMPCESMFFKFDINIDDTHNIKMNVRKIDKNKYKVTFTENDWTVDDEISDLKALPQIIGEMIKKYII